MRNELWKKAYESLRNEQPTVIEAYEALAKDQNGLQVAEPLRPDSMSIVVQKQKQKMESKQWTYTWFGKPRRVRDNVESVLKVVQEASGLISAGMTLAPVYVSLPWSMISILIPFVMNDSKSMTSAVDGLKEITAITASYSYAEKEFLKHEVTRSDFKDIVTDLYAAILEYQASVAIYFAKSTLKRLGLSLSSKLSWTEAIAKTRSLDNRCRVALEALDTSLGQHGFGSLEKVLQQGMKLMQQISQSLSAERNQRQRIIDWVSPINPDQDHTDVRRLLGDEYFGTGQWLLRDDQQYLPWKASDGDVLLLQGGMGSGKSSLVSVVIEDLMGDVGSRLAFMYCSANASPLDRNRTIRNDTGNIIRCLLAQCAVLADGSIVPSIQAAFDRSGRQEPGGCDLSIGVLVPRQIYESFLTLIVHPGPPGDAGPSALDWVLMGDDGSIDDPNLLLEHLNSDPCLSGRSHWGVTILHAIEEFDAGPIWAFDQFPLDIDQVGLTKSELYRGLMALAAIAATLAAVSRIQDAAISTGHDFAGAPKSYADLSSRTTNVTCSPKLKGQAAYAVLAVSDNLPF